MTAMAVRERQTRREPIQTRPLRSWWGMRRRRGTDVEDLNRGAARRAEEALAVLELARKILAHRWIQNSWYLTEKGRRAGQNKMFSSNTVDPGEVAGACVVGALALAVSQRLTRADLTVEGGPMIDYVWDALQEKRGLGGPGVAGRAAPREVRLARMRDLVHWNDQPRRTQGEVLNLLDLAISRVIFTAMRQPVGPRPEPETTAIEEPGHSDPAARRWS